MERSQLLFDEAGRRVKVADHMLTMTYPLVKDPKLLIAVLDNVYKSMDASMAAALVQALEQKKVPYVPEDFEGRFRAYKQYLANKNKTPVEVLRALHEIKETIQEHATSPISFRRQEKFVICTEGYKIRTLSEETLKKYVRLAKIFHTNTKGIA